MVGPFDTSANLRRGSPGSMLATLETFVKCRTDVLPFPVNRPKSALRDVGKALGFELAVVEALAKDYRYGQNEFVPWQLGAIT
jgi:hypothetical protein